MNLFPFQLPVQEGWDLWRAYRAAAHPDLSWYEVDVTVVSPNEVTFYVYGMESATHGGRGELKGKFDARVKAASLAEMIAHRKLRLAEWELDRREAEAARARRAAAIDAIHLELFGDVPK
jgi:ligand-binding SRPBCC domain-containing protein